MTNLNRVLLALMLCASLNPQLGQACAPAYGRGAFVRIAEESAIIVWDEKTHIQHFIRRATFDTDAPDFGFLVPTPVEPELAEVSNSAFINLEDIIRPETIEKTKITGFNFTPLLLSRLGGGFPRRGAAQPEVNVLSTQRVAGYDAVVLGADNAAELNGWLDKHGYASSPSLTEWLAPYLARRWKITAFKIAKDANYHQVGTSAVKMSFKTDRPFFPYREPANQREGKEATGGNRLLRIYFLSSSRVEGAIRENSAASWPGQTVWTDRLSSEGREKLMSLFPSDMDLSSNSWLSVFEDKSSPRPGTDDVYFKTSNNQETIHLPPVIINVPKDIPAPLDILVLISIGGLILLRQRKKRRISRI